MPKELSAVTITLKGKEREFFAGVAVLRDVRKATGLNILGPEAQDILTNRFDEFIPAILYFGVDDRSDLGTLPEFERKLSVKEFLELGPVVAQSLGMETEAKN